MVVVYEPSHGSEYAMETKGLTLVVVVLLLGGIVLLIFGFSMVPAVREAIGNVSHGEITGKPNIQKVSGPAQAGPAGIKPLGLLIFIH